jgi:hypothetical protein
MSTAWRYTAMILVGATLLLGAGLFTLRTGLVASGGPRGLRETRQILRQLGGEPGLNTRKQQLTAIVARLRQERIAHAADAGAFSRRIEETFAELGLGLTASSEWKPVPKFKVPGAAAFERTLAGSGPFDRLLEAMATIESWPDEARIRALSIVRQESGNVTFTLEITAVRAAAREAH